MRRKLYDSEVVSRPVPAAAGRLVHRVRMSGADS